MDDMGRHTWCSRDRTKEFRCTLYNLYTPSIHDKELTKTSSLLCTDYNSCVCTDLLNLGDGLERSARAGGLVPPPRPSSIPCSICSTNELSTVRLPPALVISLIKLTWALYRLLSLFTPNHPTYIPRIPSFSPISIDGSSGSGETFYLDKSNVLDCVSSCNKRTCYVLCLQLLLIVWAGCVTVGILSNDVILTIFHFVRLTYAEIADPTRLPDGLTSYTGERDFVEWRRSWRHPLIHVCREWRSIIFASPNFLDLRLVCVRNTRMELIGIWPPFPIIIRNNFRPMPDNCDFDAAIVHRNRVCEIDLRLTSLQLQRWAPAMQEQFPALTHLSLSYISSHPPLAPALPDRFLGGSAPTLQTLELKSIPFAALPKLLLSATNLVCLGLRYIPHSEYISPEVIVTALAVLANLESLAIGFESPLSCPDRERRRPPPPTRTATTLSLILSSKGSFTLIIWLLIHELYNFVDITVILSSRRL